jgi:hypothetical protein
MMEHLQTGLKMLEFNSEDEEMLVSVDLTVPTNGRLRPLQLDWKDLKMPFLPLKKAVGYFDLVKREMMCEYRFIAARHLHKFPAQLQRSISFWLTPERLSARENVVRCLGVRILQVFAGRDCLSSVCHRHYRQRFRSPDHCLRRRCPSLGIFSPVSACVSPAFRPECQVLYLVSAVSDLFQDDGTEEDRNVRTRLTYAVDRGGDLEVWTAFLPGTTWRMASRNYTEYSIYPRIMNNNASLCRVIRIFRNRAAHNLESNWLAKLP